MLTINIRRSHKIYYLRIVVDSKKWIIIRNWNSVSVLNFNEDFGTTTFIEKNYMLLKIKVQEYILNQLLHDQNNKQ